MRDRTLATVLGATFLACCLGGVARAADADGLKEGVHYRRTWAVFVGISDYQGGLTGFPTLPGAANDARTVYELLCNEFHGYAKERIDFVPSKDADQKRVLGALDWLGKRDLRPEDAVLFFFAGHGQIGPSPQREGFLITTESSVDKSVRMSEVRRRLALLPCEHKLVILDCCYSGQLFSEAEPPPERGGAAGKQPDWETGKDPLPLHVRRPAFVGISSGEDTEVFGSNSTKQHSAFTQVLLEMLLERAGTRRKDHIFFFRQHLAPRVAAGVEDSQKQVPNWGYLGPGAGDFTFCPKVPRPTRVEIERRRVSLALGWNLADRDDLMGSLNWFAHAAELDPMNAEVHRTRFAGVLRSCPRLVRLWAQGREAADAAISPDGRLVVVGGDDGTVTFRDPVTGGPAREPVKYLGGVDRVVFSADGSRLVVLCGSALYVWDAVKLQPLKEFRYSGLGWIVGPALNRDGTLLAVAVGESVLVWDLEKGGDAANKSLRQRYDVNRVSFSPDGKHLLAAAGGVFDLPLPAPGTPPQNIPGSVRIWGAVSKDLVKEFDSGGYAAYSPDGKHLAVCNTDGTVRVEDLTGVKDAIVIRAENTLTFPVTFSPDGRRLVTGHGFLPQPGGEVRVWDAQSGRAVGQPLTHPAWMTRAAFSRDGRRLLTVTQDGDKRNEGQAWAWDLAESRLIGAPLRHNGWLTAASFDPTGRLVLTAGRDGTARFWNLTTAGERADMIPFPIPRKAGIVLARSADQRLVLTSPGGTRAQVWDVNKPEPPPPVLDNGAEVSWGALSADGRWAVTWGGMDWTKPGQARVWEVATGKSAGPALSHDQGVNFAVFSPPGPRPDAKRAGLLTLTFKQAQVWDFTTGKEVGRPMKPQGIGSLHHAAFSPDGRYVVTAGSASERGFEGQARVWDARSGAAVSALMKHKKDVRFACFSPDGRQVATASEDQTARIWNALTGEPVTAPMPHSEAVGDVAFSPDGLYLATAAGTTAWVWNAVTGQLVCGPLDHGERVQEVGFTHSGALLVSSGTLVGHAQVWDAATGDLVARPDPAEKVTLRIGTQYFATDTTRATRLWDLAPDRRPLADLKGLAGILSGREIAPDGTARAVARDDLVKSWEALHKKYPAEFAFPAEAAPARPGK